VIDGCGKRTNGPTPIPPGVLIASAQLKTSEVQELGDQIGSIGNAAVGYDLRVTVQIEVGAGGKRPPESIVASINGKLKEISPELESK
jgi:hypothetical protein